MNTQFEYPKAALNYMKRNRNTGVEKSLNESVFFGVGNGIYAYTDDCKNAGLETNGGAFTHLENREADLLQLLSWVMQMNGGFITVQ